jgi:hypothetical protein
MIVTIHQPNFFPWNPFFEKIEQADLFVILTHCQFEKNGYQNRFNYNGKWYTLSVKKGLDLIVEKVYTDPVSNWKTIKNRLPEHKNFLNEFDDCLSFNLVQTNTKIINRLLNIFDIKTKVVLDYKTHLKSTDRLVDICKTYGATKYLAGSGSKSYLDKSKFEDVGIEVDFQVIKTPVHILDTL